jgi:hypothetical protein
MSMINLPLGLGAQQYDDLGINLNRLTRPLLCYHFLPEAIKLSDCLRLDGVVPREIVDGIIDQSPEEVALASAAQNSVSIVLFPQHPAVSRFCRHIPRQMSAWVRLSQMSRIEACAQRPGPRYGRRVMAQAGPYRNLL